MNPWKVLGWRLAKSFGEEEKSPYVKVKSGTPSLVGAVVCAGSEGSKICLGCEEITCKCVCVCAWGTGAGV